MPAPKVTDSVTEGVDMDSTCATMTYENTADPTDGKAGTVTSKCGFNQGTKAYCPQQMGNDAPKEAFTAWAKDMNSVNAQCHLGGNPGACTAFTKELSASIAENTAKVGAANLATPQGYPNIADNPSCVKSTITRWYWNEDGSATGIAIGAAAATLAIIF